MILVVFEGPLHDFEELPLTCIVDLANLGLELMEPHFYGVELGAVRRQVHDPDTPAIRQLHGFLLVVDGAVVHDQPLLSPFLGAVEPLEQLMDEVEILVFAIVAINDPPVRQPLLPNDSNQ